MLMGADRSGAAILSQAETSRREACQMAAGFRTITRAASLLPSLLIAAAALAQEPGP
jgi:hypothetical protein